MTPAPRQIWENPQKKSVPFQPTSKAGLAVPDDISESNIHEMLQPLDDGLQVLTKFEDNTNISGVQFHDKSIIIKLRSTNFFINWFRNVGEMD